MLGRGRGKLGVQVRSRSKAFAHRPLSLPDRIWQVLDPYISIYNSRRSPQCGEINLWLIAHTSLLRSSTGLVDAGAAIVELPLGDRIFIF
jgi:hypothetical protein